MIAFAVAVIGLHVGVADVAAQPRVRVDGPIEAVAFSADGVWFAVGHSPGGVAGGVTVYKAKRRGKPIELPRMDKPIAFVGFADGGKYVVAADSGNELAVWSLPKGEEVFRVKLRDREGKAKSTFIPLSNPKAPYVGWVERPKEGDEIVEVARIPGGKVVSSISKVKSARQAAWSRDGSSLILSGAVWNWDTFKSLRPSAPGFVSVSDDGARIARVNGTGGTASFDSCEDISLIELGTAKTMRTVSFSGGACPRFLWFAREGKGLVWVAPASSSDASKHAVLQWDPKRDQIRTVKRGLKPVVSADLSPDGKVLAVSDGLRVRFVAVR